MKKNASLALIEQAIMLLILAAAAALCLRLFAWADTRSLENTRKDQALVQLQSAAETLKSHKGDFSAAAQAHGGRVENGQWLLYFDGQWAADAQDPAFYLQATPLEINSPYLGAALLEVFQQDGHLLGSLEIYWQEDGS